MRGLKHGKPWASRARGKRLSVCLSGGAESAEEGQVLRRGTQRKAKKKRSPLSLCARRGPLDMQRVPKKRLRNLPPGRPQFRPPPNPPPRHSSLSLLCSGFNPDSPARATLCRTGASPGQVLQSLALLPLIPELCLPPALLGLGRPASPSPPPRGPTSRPEGSRRQPGPPP